jgi:hypothetical protein
MTRWPKHTARAALFSAVLLAAFGSVRLAGSRFLKRQDSKVLRVAYPIFSSVTSIDPAHVSTANEASLVRNIYSRLVEYSNDGKLVGGVAESFEWRGDEIRLPIRKNLKTIDGWQVTARDVEISLKRLLIKQSNTHGDLANFLCPGARLEKLNDECRGIRVDGNTVILIPADESKKTFLLPLLASLDFSIIPEMALSRTGRGLEIADFRNTSGPYYVERDDIKGSYLLRANPSHYRYSLEMPQSIQIVSTRHEEMIPRFESGEVDLIPTVDSPRYSDILKLRERVPESDLHQTLPIKIWAVMYSRRAQSELSDEQRIYLGKKIRAVYLNTFADVGINPTLEFFPVLGDGSLSSEQRDALMNVYSKDDRPVFKRKIIFGAPPSNVDRVRRAFIGIPEVEVVEIRKALWELPENEQPDLGIFYTDSAFYEDISLISYNAEIGTFGMSRGEGVKWLNQYMATSEKLDRLELLRRLHFDILKRGLIIPLGAAPYYALVKSPWKFDTSKFYAGMSLWQIKRQ